MLRTAVCDDNNIACKRIEKIVRSAFAKHDKNAEIICHTSGIVLMNEHKRSPFDIIFLDIDMPDMNGFDIAGLIRDELSDCFIIFITSHSELVYNSLDYQPFHFIRKNCGVPLEESIPQIVERLFKHIRQNEKIILEDDISGKCAVSIGDIVYLESDRHYVKYHISGRENSIRVRETIKECEEKYKEYHFVKIHKSFILNMKYIWHINMSDNDITLKINQKRLPMSRNLKKIVDEEYMMYLRSKA